MDSLLKRLVIIKTASNDQGSGIIISNDGLIASCYHNFFSNGIDGMRDMKTIAINHNDMWLDSSYNDNAENAFPSRFYDDLKQADLFFIRLSSGNDSGDLTLSDRIEKSDRVYVVAFDEELESKRRCQRGEVIAKEYYTSFHPSRIRLNVRGYSGFSGGGVFNEDSELIGIINYVKESRNDEIIASIFPEWIIRYINENRAKNVLEKREAVCLSSALSISDLRKPLKSIQLTKNVTIFPQTTDLVVDSLELLSAAALGDCWFSSHRAQTDDECPEIRALLTPFDEQAKSNEAAQKCLAQAAEINLLWNDDHYKFCLAAYRLGRSLGNCPEYADSLVFKVLEQIITDDRLHKKRQAVLSLSLSYWPEGYGVLYRCGENLIQRDLRRMTDAYQLDVLSQTIACDIMLGSTWYSDDIQRVPLSQRWVEATGWFGVLPDIFFKLFKGSVERLRQHWEHESVPLTHRYPYIRAFRLSGLDHSELRNLGLALACSLPDATQTELNALQQSRELMTWLLLMQDPEIKIVNENHIRLLVEILARRYTSSDLRLAKLAREALTVPHRNLDAVWESLGNYRKLWVRELTEAELIQDNIKRLAKQKKTCETEAAKLLVSRLAESHTE